MLGKIKNHSKALLNKRKARNRFIIKKYNLSKRPRLSVYKSGVHIYVQVIDDVNSVTLVSASTVEKTILSQLKSTANIEAAKLVGKIIAERALAANIKEVVFDRGGYVFHGRVKALAEAARENGLKI